MSISELGNISLELGKLHFGNQAESGVWLGGVAEEWGWGGGGGVKHWSWYRISKGGKG